MRYAAEQAYEDRCERDFQSSEALTEEAAELAERELRFLCTHGILHSDSIDWMADHDGSTVDDYVAHLRESDSDLWRDAVDEAARELANGSYQ